MSRRWWQIWSPAHAPRLGHLHLVLYTRAGCHLCEAAWDQLQEGQRRFGYLLAAVDVDSDPELQARYGEHVPVVTVNGKVRFRGRVNPVLLRRLLEAELHSG
jgi:glutaredoxin